MVVGRSAGLLVTLSLLTLPLIKGTPEKAQVNYHLEITRQNIGDVFTTEEMECTEESCIGLSSGTAATVRVQITGRTSQACTCQCHSHLPVYREDRRICVDDINECMLTSFVGGSTSQKIPFIFLPLKGQIIHPSKEISFTGMETPVCAVSGAKYLNEDGWVELRNPLDNDVPFRLFLDEGRTFLQWVGESDLRTKISGRLVLVSLMCKEISETSSTVKTIFSPCIAFRVVGSQKKHLSADVNSVMFIPSDAHPSEVPSSAPQHLSMPEYVAIGVSSVLLGLIYVASVLLYLHLRRQRLRETKLEERRGSAVEEGVVKKNPLLGMSVHNGRRFGGELSEGSEDSDGGMDGFREIGRAKKLTSVLIHPSQTNADSVFYSNAYRKEFSYPESSNMEKLPEENVSIVETLEQREDREDALKAITGMTRKKLYFNPAYFEPQLLLAPPPAAIEFLCKIREVISIAKTKMNMKRFAPSLMRIPEEEFSYPVETSHQFASPKSKRSNSNVSLKRENSRRKTYTGCEECGDLKLTGSLSVIPQLGACKNCSLFSSNRVIDSKQMSIRKWLENVPQYDNGNLELKCKAPKRVRSPTRSLPPVHVNTFESYTSKTVSERAVSPSRNDTYFSSQRSLDELDNSRRAKTKRSHHTKSLPPPDMIHEAMVLDKKQKDSPNTRIVKADVEVCRGRPTNFYEIDSLDRSQQPGYHTPSEYAEVSSSQPSPSLSTALPMDEEMTIRNAVVTKFSPSHISKSSTRSVGDGEESNDDDLEYELIVMKRPSDMNKSYNLVSEVYVNSGYGYGSVPSTPGGSACNTLDRNGLRVRYDGHPGKLLIEVEDCPDNYIRVDDEEDFEPDTLDRKPPPKPRVPAVVDYVDSLERPPHILLRSSGSFRKDLDLNEQPTSLNGELNRTFGSLREVYEARIKGVAPSSEGTVVLKSSQGPITIVCPKTVEERILTLEDRHCKRQRNMSIKSGVQPDVIPPPPHEEGPLYEYPKPPRKVEVPENTAKTFCKTEDIKQKKPPVTYDSCSKENQLQVLEKFVHMNDINIKNEPVVMFASTSQCQPRGVFPLETKIPSKKSDSAKTKTQYQLEVQKPEDSGYLSSDSSEYRRIKCKTAESPQNGNDNGSESEQSFGDGHSESGAESVETHSVFFDIFRKANKRIISAGSSRGTTSGNAAENCIQRSVNEENSDSEETVSYTTIVPLSSNVSTISSNGLLTA